MAIARSKEPLESLAKEFPHQVVIVVGDVAEPETCSRAVEAAVSTFGSVDSVVANAGVLDPVDPIAKADVSKWKRLFDVNFFSVVGLVAAALPHLEKSHGRVVAVSSGASDKAYNAWGAYGSSKAALNHLVMLVAQENPNVLAISVAPGVVATEMQKDIREKFGANMTPESLQRFIDLHSNDQLLPPDVPASVYANLAVRGWDKHMNGKYFRVGDAALAAYLK